MWLFPQIDQAGLVMIAPPSSLPTIGPLCGGGISSRHNNHTYLNVCPISNKLQKCTRIKLYQCLAMGGLLCRGGISSMHNNLTNLYVFPLSNKLQQCKRIKHAPGVLHPLFTNALQWLAHFEGGAFPQRTTILLYLNVFQLSN